MTVTTCLYFIDALCTFSFYPLVDAEVKGDEYWDYDQQVDLEGFTSGRFYNILAKQSREVTGAIARQKDQAKQLYQKINQQTESLKGLWIAKLNLRGRAAMATPEDLRAFEAKKGEVCYAMLKTRAAVFYWDLKQRGAAEWF